jgi:Leucine-rich repeat (LRR) protein
MVCEGGEIICSADTGVSEEICDGVDNDFDGAVDNGNPGGGEICDTGLLGVCSSGTTVCESGEIICSADIGVSEEICDGLDNDCDGAVDNGNPGGGEVCDTGLLGVCSSGTMVCEGGEIICSADTGVSAEICDDGLDNDCDGFSDTEELDCGAPEAPERLALIALYNYTDGDNWADNTGWLGDPGTECDWYGVTCTPGSGLTGINLANNQLTGIIPHEIGNLPGLRRLYLYTNNLTGDIPSELWTLTNLEKLGLGDNQLTGTIPSAIGNLNELRYLALNINQLTGSIPAEIGNLTGLSTLSLGNNQLTGSIPAEIGNLTNLQQLRLANNQLTGNIPPEIGNLANLLDLGLSFNQLSGDVPFEIGNLSGLQFLYLYNNQLTGYIPVEIGNLTNLQRLILSDNQLEGDIPPEIGNLTSLVDLRLDRNQLTGNISSEIGNLRGLQILYLYKNQLTGYIPAEIGNLTLLQFLVLNNNRLTGRLPPALGNLIDLVYLDIAYNQLNGSIPSTFSDLAALEYFNVTGNCLVDFEPVSHVPELIGVYAQTDTCKSKGLPWLLMLLLDDEESVNLTCDSNDILLCDNRSDCVAVGGYWWSDNFCRGVSESETVESVNGRIWMDRNLGASRVATILTDSEAYGDLYQWGRDADGHQLRTSVTTSVLSSTDDPGHGVFITTTTPPYDWRNPQNDNLWQGVAGTNNPCPAGFRLPTITEWEAERVSWSSNDSAGAFGSPLKLVAAGSRGGSGSLNGVSGLGYYWSATVGGTWARSLGFGSGASVGYYKSRASGSSLRCIMD